MPNQTNTSLTKTDGGRLFTPFTMLLGALLLWLALAVPLNAQIPGLQFPAGSEASDQKPGSILFYNYITSSASPVAQNTLISLTNTSTTTAVTLRLFFVDGTTGASTSAFLSLVPIQTAQFLASDFAPGLTGYLMVVAVNSSTLCPINFNNLIGDAYIKRASGHRAGLSAIAIAAIAANPAACGGATTALNFDGVNYNRVPRTLALDSVPSRADGNDTLFVLNRVGGNLTSGGNAATIGTLSGLLFNSGAQGLNFTQTASTPQFVASLTNSFPVTSPLFETFIPSVVTGYMRFFNNTDFGYFGAALNFNPNVNNASFNTGQNFTHRTVTATQTVTVPVGAPDLTVTKTHSGNFTVGSTGAYTINVTNNSSTAMAASGNTIVVSDNLPGNLTLASFSGAGWGCTGLNSNNVTCQINATLGANASAAPLTLTVNVGAGTPTGTNSITNTVNVATLQEFNSNNNSASDPTTVTAASDPCSTFLPIAYGQTINGVLQSGDCTTLFGDGSFSNLYTFNGTAGDQIAIALNSSAFDAYLVLYNPSGISIAADNNGGGGTNARIPATSGFFTLPVTGSYYIAANTFVPSGSGAYSLTLISSTSGLQFYPLPRPVRLLDTRAGQGNCDAVSTPITGGTSITLLARATCEGITIPATAQAIVGNITVINQTAQNGYLTLYPTGQSAPVAANMIYGPNGLLSNNFTVGLNASGQVNIFGERTIHVVVDISGYYAPPGQGGLYFHPLSKPIRLLDTRAGQGNCDSISSPIAAGTSLTTTAAARTCEGLTIPAAAQAIVGNATVINGSGQTGYLTIYPDGVAPPVAANIIYLPGSVLSNAFTVGLSGAGKFNIFGEKTIDMAIDVAGYYSTEPTDVNGPGLLFTPLSRPVRILDTRAGQGNCDAVSTPIAAGGSIAAAGRLTCEAITIPVTAQAILGNVTVINLTASAGYMTMYPDGVAAPLAANMIYTPGQLLSNAFFVGLNASNGNYRIFGERTIEAIIDASGYFAP